MSCHEVRVRLTHSWLGWKELKDIYDGELRAIDEALKLKKTPKWARPSSHDDFANHLLDVHRNWCEACPAPGGRRAGHQEDSGGSAAAAVSASAASASASGFDVIVLKPNAKSVASSINTGLVGKKKMDQSTQTIQNVFNCCHCGLSQLDKPMPPLARIQPGSQRLVSYHPSKPGQRINPMEPIVGIQSGHGQTIKRSNDIYRPDTLSGVQMPPKVKVIKVTKSKGGVQGQQSHMSSQALTKLMQSGHVLHGTRTGSSQSSVGGATESGKIRRTIVVNVPNKTSSGFLSNVPTRDKLSPSSSVKQSNTASLSTLVDPLSFGGKDVSASTPVVKMESLEDIVQLPGPAFSQTRCVDENDDEEDHIYDDGNVNLDHEEALDSSQKMSQSTDHLFTVSVKEEVLSDEEQPDSKRSEEGYLYDPTQDQESKDGQSSSRGRQSSGTGWVEGAEKADLEMEDEEGDEEYNELEDEMEDEMEDEEEIDYEKQEKTEPSYDPSSSGGKRLHSKKDKDQSDPMYMPNDDFNLGSEDGPEYPSSSKEEKPCKRKKPSRNKKSKPTFKFPKECPVCSEALETQPEMVKHLETHIPIEEGSEAIKKAVKSIQSKFQKGHNLKMGWCEDCKKLFLYLRNHLTAYHTEEQLCQHCGKVVRAGAMKRHLITHMEVDESDYVQCPQCPSKFKHKIYLGQHMCLVHTSERNRQCLTCGKVFKSKKNLRNHEAIHIETKRHSCLVCGRGFTQQGNLNIHMRQHTGDKPYVCEICEAAFTNNVSLKTHKKNYHGIDWWKDRESLKDEDPERPDSPTL